MDGCFPEELTTLGRVLGIDYGSRRIGISISDPLKVIAQSLDTIPNDPQVFKRIKELVDREQVELIVVGMPVNLKGEKGQKAQEVESFTTQLALHIQLEIVKWDERFTTRRAHQTLLEMGTKRKSRREQKGRVDAMAAAIMLQSFLDRCKRSLSC